jgi:hypothetical protein
LRLFRVIFGAVILDHLHISVWFCISKQILILSIVSYLHDFVIRSIQISSLNASC